MSFASVTAALGGNSYQRGEGVVERLRCWLQSIKTYAAHQLRGRLERLQSSEWLASAFVLGGLVGAATLVQIGADSPSGFALSSASETYLEALIGLLITFVGFVIIAVVFVYEQQRRAWRIAFRILDLERKVVVRGAALSVGCVVIAIWSALVALGQDRDGSLLLQQTWPTLIAAVSGFGGTAGAVATVVMGVRLLSSRQLAARILSAPERISTRDASEEPVRPSDLLMELALAEHRVEDDEEFRSRIGSLRHYGEAAVSPADALDAVRALLDVAILVHGRRGRVMAAVLAAQKVLESNIALKAPDGHSADVGRDAWAEEDRTEHDKLLRKALALLDLNLSHGQPSGSLLRETIELGRRIDPSSRRIQELVTRAIEGTLFRVNPSDLWENVVPALLKPAFGAIERDLAAERALVIALTHAIDPSAPELVSAGPGTRLAAERTLELLPQLSVLADDPPAVLDPAEVQQFYVRVLLCLRMADGSAGDVPVKGSILIARKLASRARHLPNYEWSIPLPAGYRSSLIMLSAIHRVLDDPGASASMEQTGKLKPSLWSHTRNAGVLLVEDPSVMIDVVEFVLDQFPDIVNKRRAAIVVRLMLWANEPLRGISALSSFVVLKAMASHLHRGLRSGAPVEDLGTLDMYFNSTSQPAAGFFSPGLAKCSERAVVLLEATNSIAKATNSIAKEVAYRAPNEALTSSDGRPDAEPGDEANGAKTSSFVVFGRFALLLAAALAVHLDDYDGIAAFGRLAATMEGMPIESPSGMPATSVGQMLADGFALATLIHDFVKPRTGKNDAARHESEDFSDADSSNEQRINYGRTLESITGLSLLCRICETDLPADVEDRADLEASLSELRDKTDGLVKIFAPPLGEEIISRLTLPWQRSQAVLPWSTFPDWAWKSAAAAVAGRKDLRLPDGATLSMVATITEERPDAWQRASGFAELITQLVGHGPLSDFAQGMLIAMLADEDVARGELPIAQRRLEAARQGSHHHVAIRQMFMEFATSKKPPGGGGLYFARRLAGDPNPRKAFAGAGIGLRWMRAVHRLSLGDCMRKLLKISDQLVPVALAEQALRGQSLDVRRTLGVGAKRLNRFATICQRNIERMESDADDRRELIPGLDPKSDLARLVGLHIVRISIAAQLQSQERKEQAKVSVDTSLALLEDIPGSIGTQLRTSLDFAVQVLSRTGLETSGKRP